MKLVTYSTASEQAAVGALQNNEVIALSAAPFIKNLTGQYISGCVFFFASDCRRQPLEPRADSLALGRLV